MKEVCEKLALASADRLEDSLQGPRTPGKRSKTEPFKLTDFSSKKFSYKKFSSKKPVTAPATVDS
jgi:hypothetical protein